MNNEKNFYDILSSKFSNNEAPFDEENWKKMRKIIDKSRADKNRTLWIAASIGLLAIAGGTFAVLEFNSGSNKQGSTLVLHSNLNKQPGISTNNSVKVSTTSTNTENSASKVESGNNNPVAVANVTTPISNNSKVEIHHSKKVTTQTESNNSIASANDNTALFAVGTKPENTVANNGKLVNKADNSNNVAATINVTTTKASPAVANTIHKADSATTANDLPPRFSDEPRIFRGKTNIFSAELGAEYTFGWQVGNIVQGKGYNPIVGIAYSHYMGSKFFIKTGVQFSIFGNMNTFPYNYERTSGNVIYDSAITTNNLYFIKIPLQFEYYLGHKSSIGAGGSVWFLLGNSGYATTYQQHENFPPSNVIRYSQNASLSGYNKVNASVYGLYRYTINSHFSVSGIFYFELTSLKSNSFFGDNIIDRTKGLQILASYSF